MQNGQSGHISFTNQFHLEKNVLLGLQKNAEFPAKVLLGLLKEPEQINIRMEGVMMDDFMACHKHGNTHPVYNAIKPHKTPKLPKALKEMSVLFGQSELSFLLLDEEVHDVDVLLGQTAFKDLFVMDYPLVKYIAEQNYKFLFNTLCPVFILPRKLESINHIIFLFDGTDSSIKALRRFIAFFHERVIHTKLFAFLMITEDHPGDTQKERIVVNFLLENFKDVGVQTVTVKGVEKDITRISNYYKNCCIITGNTGAKKILLSNITKLLAIKDVPLFYSN